MGEASVKVEGGKMVNLEIEDSVSLTGDFFIEPPEARREIEKDLERLGTDAAQEEVVQAVENVDADLIGFSAEDIAEAFDRVKNNG